MCCIGVKVSKFGFNVHSQSLSFRFVQSLNLLIALVLYQELDWELLLFTVINKLYVSLNSITRIENEKG